MKVKKYILIGCLLMALVTVTAYCGNLWFESQAKAETVRKNLAHAAINSIKHAYAASQLYTLFRTLHVTDSSSQSVVVFLGKMNECAELVLNPLRRRDSTDEIKKDLHNNIVGVQSARWLELHGKESHSSMRLQTLGTLAKGNILLLSPTDVNTVYALDLPTSKPRFRLLDAYEWFDQHQQVIILRTIKFMDKGEKGLDQ
ncbi:MAG: hypothetical protein IPP74_03195 [Alphaproteobacteria bacterium]|nr:hypothetical protein [Alphaproteobacteria bacterium]